MSTTGKISVNEYDRMITSDVFDEHRRLELIHGELHQMTPIGPRHEEVVDRLNRWSMLNVSHDQVRVRIQNSIGLHNLQSVPEPDVVWVAPRNYMHSRPTANDVYLVIEVAHSSLDYDRGEKAALYAAAGIADYCVVNLVDWQVEIFRSAAATGYEFQYARTGQETISPLRFPEIELPISQLFEEI